jgi:hypothetical protein
VQASNLEASPVSGNAAAGPAHPARNSCMRWSTTDYQTDQLAVEAGGGPSFPAAIDRESKTKPVLPAALAAA